jgi:signal transduction histidine kinase/DNA-binding response OmpR family regulator
LSINRGRRDSFKNFSGAATLNWFFIVFRACAVLSLCGLSFLSRADAAIKETSCHGADSEYREESPDSISRNPHSSSIVITGFVLLNQGDQKDIESCSVHNLTDDGVIRLAYNQNNISLAVSFVDYDSSYTMAYRYKLEGVDKEWHHLGNRHYVTYIDVPDGKYIFRIQALDVESYRMDEDVSLSIIITPPWWRAPWAYLGYMAVMGIGLYGFRQLNVSRIRLRQQLQTEHFQAEKLRELDNMKSRFFANISHELRTPLTLIMAPVDQALSETHEQATKKKLKLVRNNARKLLAMINQLLEFSRLESGNIKLLIRCGDYVSFTRRVVGSFQSWADRKRIVLLFTSEVERLPGYFDQEKLEQILSNLLSNAMKFTPEEGTVVVTLKTEAPWVVVTVKDTGEGIALVHIDHIFDRFYRVDDSHRTEGTGIGLAYTKHLVELHRGIISVVSEQGKGSIFTVRLPIGTNNNNAEALIGEENGGSISLNARERSYYEDQEYIDVHTGAKDDAGMPLILIVEDNADVRVFTRTILEHEYRFIESSDGYEGVEQAMKEIPDLVISDVMMPRIDGYELCRRLKNDSRTSHIPVILLTAKAATENKLKGLETGADDYITKPFEACELKIRVNNLIKQRQLLRERFRREITLQPKDIAITPVDERFLNRAMEVVEAHMSDQSFTAEQFAQEMFLSRMQFHRKIRALTDLSPWQFVRRMRMRRAADILKNRAGNIAETANEVGYDSPSKFAHAFREEFGMTPSAYQVETHQNEKIITPSSFSQ